MNTQINDVLGTNTQILRLLEGVFSNTDKIQSGGSVELAKINEVLGKLNDIHSVLLDIRSALVCEKDA